MFRGYFYGDFCEVVGPPSGYGVRTWMLDRYQRLSASGAGCCPAIRYNRFLQLYFHKTFKKILPENWLEPECQLFVASVVYSARWVTTGSTNKPSSKQSSELPTRRAIGWVGREVGWSLHEIRRRHYYFFSCPSAAGNREFRFSSPKFGERCSEPPDSNSNHPERTRFHDPVRSGSCRT